MPKKLTQRKATKAVEIRDKKAASTKKLSNINPTQANPSPNPIKAIV
jgi:hypothetical protein